MEPLLSRRILLRAAGAAAVAAVAGCGTPAAPAQASPSAGPQRLRLLGETTLPHRMEFRGTTVGGLSAIDFDPATGLWVALSDDRSELQPARFYRLELDPRAPDLALRLRDVVTLRQAGGQPYPPHRFGGEVVDPEGLRLLPGGQGLLWSSEGDPRVQQSPALHLARPDGTHVRRFAVPPLLQLPRRPGTGPRRNEAFEGLALTPDGRTAWAAMEGPLLQDGPEPAVGRPGGPVRITAFDVATGRPLRQIAYQPDALPLAPLLPGAPADNGVSEILMRDAHRMLVLERAYAMGAGNSLRLYEIDTREAGDVLAVPALEGHGARTPAKKLVADFAHLGLARLDNTEGMAWGPRLPGGRRTLVVVSDDNFNPMQATQFAAFEYLD